MRRAAPTPAQEIRAAYQDAMDKGLWQDHYASTNASEYSAKGTQTWFWSNYEYVDGDRRVMTPDDLKGYDPRLYELLYRVYPDHHIPADIYHGKGRRPRQQEHERDIDRRGTALTIDGDKLKGKGRGGIRRPKAGI